MDARRIEFAEALAHLQGMLCREVRVTVGFPGTFGSCVLEGRLDRVETLPPDDAAVNVVVEGRQGLLLDPADTLALTVGVGAGSPLEFHIAGGVRALVEPA